MEKRISEGGSMKKTLTVPEQHQYKIARGILSMSIPGALITGGMSHKEAVAFLIAAGEAETSIKYWLLKAGHSAEDIEKFMKP
jgi:hypothetical protein